MPLNLRNFGHSIFLLIQTFRTYITYTISHWIYAVLGIRFFCKSRHSVRIMYTISCLIDAIFNIQFFCYSKYSVHIYRTQFSIEFLQHWTFNFFANTTISCIYNVHNFSMNFSSFGYSIFLQIQSFRTYIMYSISRWILVVLDIQFFYTSRDSIHIMYTICLWIYIIWVIQIFC